MTSPNEAPVLFAVPAPRSVGKGLLCLCRKVYWRNGDVVHCVYAPVNKKDATELLRDPNAINVLNNPNDNLLTVSASGAIIGVQQTVGSIKSPPTSPTVLTVATSGAIIGVQQTVGRIMSPPTSPTVVTPPFQVSDLSTNSAILTKQENWPPTDTKPTAPSEEVKVPSTSPALPQSTKTQTSQQFINYTPPGLSHNSFMPKISAVCSLAKPVIPSNGTFSSPTHSCTEDIAPLDLRIAKYTAKPRNESQNEDETSPVDTKATFPNGQETKQRLSKKAVKRNSFTKIGQTTPNKQTVCTANDPLNCYDAKPSKLKKGGKRKIVTKDGHTTTKKQRISTIDCDNPLKVRFSWSKCKNDEIKDTRYENAEQKTGKIIRTVKGLSKKVYVSVKSKKQEVMQAKVEGVVNTDTKLLEKEKVDDELKMPEVVQEKKDLKAHITLPTKDMGNNVSKKQEVIQNKMESFAKTEKKLTKKGRPSAACNEQDVVKDISEYAVSLTDSCGTNVVIESHRGYTFKHDTDYNISYINGKIPIMQLHKYDRVALKNLGCSPSCPLLQVLQPSPKTKNIRQRNTKTITGAKPRKQRTRQVSFLRRIPSMDALTSHPDFDLIPTSNKVEYLKEMLKAQRTAMGINV